MPLIVDPSYQSWISTSVVTWRDGNYTLGEMEPMALSHERLYLSWGKEDDEIKLSWKTVGEPKMKSLFLETSHHHDFREFTTTALKIYPSKIIFETTKVKGARYMRLKGVTEKNNTLISNIVNIPIDTDPLHVFPNPASSRLYMERIEERILFLILQDGKKIVKTLNHDETYSWINTEDLPKGMHRLLLKRKGQSEWILFFKN